MKPQNKTFLDFVQGMRDQYADRIALSQLEGDKFLTKTFEELYQKSMKVARFLMTRELSSNDNIVVLSPSKPEWVEAVFGVMLSGATVVPLDVKLTANELGHLLNHCKPKLIFYSKELGETLSEAEELHGISIPTICLDADLPNSLSRLPDFKHFSVEPVDPETCGMIVYTSGTAGNPKGVHTKQSQILFQANTCKDLMDTGSQEKFLSILPLNHLFEFSVGLCSNLAGGSEICLAKGIERDHLMACLQGRKVTQMVVVPLFLSNLMKGIMTKVKGKGILQRSIFKLMYALAPYLPVRIRRKLFSSILAPMGGEIHRMIIGSASLPKEVIRFFQNIGVGVFEGYGLSETGPVVSTNTPDDYKLGSVGKPLPGIEIKIDDPEGTGEGEILTRGPHLMRGYYLDPTLTAETVNPEGWLHTGDIGRIDDEGFLYITGRKKKMIVLDGGKKVFPEEVETLLLTDDWVQECFVTGFNFDRKALNSNRILAVVVPSEQALLTSGEADWETIEAQTIERTKKLVKGLATFKRPTDFIVSQKELPKTTTQKIKINQVQGLIDHHMSEGVGTLQ